MERLEKTAPTGQTMALRAWRSDELMCFRYGGDESLDTLSK